MVEIYQRGFGNDGDGFGEKLTTAISLTIVKTEV